jgi:HEPN domain-containing protein
VAELPVVSGPEAVRAFGKVGYETDRQRLGQEAWGHVLSRLLTELPDAASAPADLIERGRVLDGFYVPTRYPNGHPEGPPFEHYGPLQSTHAIDHADQILAFVRHRLA